MKEKSNNLKIIRKDRGLTVKEVVDGTGIPMRTYQNYEYMEREIGAGALQKLADFYGASTDYLLGRPTATPPNDPVDALISSKDFDEIEEILLKKYLELPHDARMAVVQFMHEVTEEAEKRKAQAEERNKKPPVFVIRRHVNRASAGAGYDLDNSDNWESISVLDCPEAHEADFTVEVDGNSMAPAYEDGDVVYVVLDQNVPLGKVGLFRMGGKGYIKRRGKDRLISDNPGYDDVYPNSWEDIECIGRVIGIAETVE